MIELRYWLQQQARDKYLSLISRGINANMSSDGRGVMVRL